MNPCPHQWLEVAMSPSGRSYNCTLCKKAVFVPWDDFGQADMPDDIQMLQESLEDVRASRLIDHDDIEKEMLGDQ